MRSALPDGPRTDLAILELDGAQVTDHDDHVVVRTPANPDYHWGNYVHVTTGDPDDAARWLDVFHRAHPEARHVAIGLPRMPAPASWAGYEVEASDALATSSLPQPRPHPEGYDVRELTSDADWEAQVQADLADNARSGAHPADEYERFIRAQAAGRRRLVEAGRSRWFAAFADEQLASSLGIVALGEDARYASVVTHPDHRRRGLAGHLLGLAAAWAHEQGARRFVIVTGATNPAGRLYRSVGFEPVAGDVSVYRKPVASSDAR